MSEPDRQRLEELQVGALLGDLDAAERAELESLRSSVRESSASEPELERAIAAVFAAAASRPAENLPPALQQRLTEQGLSWLDSVRSERTGAAANDAAGTSPGPAESSVPRATVTPLRSAAPAPARMGTAGWLGWALAAGLAALMLSGVFPRAPQPIAPPTARALTPAEARERMVAAGAYSVRAAFGQGNDAAGSGLSGDVVWDDRTQRGFMRLTGLRPNDPAREEYQLWIFDAERDTRYPVDGGVFDDRGGGEIVVPIRAKIPVHHAVMFAITVERPGGVVVSSRERIAGLAKAT